MATVKKIRRSVAPFYGVAAVWVVYALAFDLYRPTHFVFAAVLSTGVYLLLRAVCKDEEYEVEIPDPPKPEPASTGNPELDKIIRDGALAVEEMKRLDENIEDEKISQAIRKLELEGLVTMIPRRGAEVAQITEKSMNDVLEVRRALDALCVELACDRITKEELESLKRACDNFELAVKTKDVKKIAQADVALHDIIVQATGNSRLIQLVNNLSEQMYRYRFEYIKDISQHERLVEEHRIIYQGIVDQDKETASLAAKLHIDNQKKAIIRKIRLEREKIK